MTDVPIQRGMGALDRPAWAGDQSYFAALAGHTIAIGDQSAAHAAVAALGMPLPPDAAPPRFPPRTEVAAALRGDRVPLVALHLSALMLRNQDRPSVRIGVAAARVTTAVSATVALGFEVATQGKRSRMARAGRLVGTGVAGAALLARGLAGRSLAGIGRGIEELAERRYGERVSLSDREREATAWGLLLGRLAKNPHTPDEALVVIAKEFTRSCGRSGLGGRHYILSSTYERVYRDLNRGKLGGDLGRMAQVVKRARTTRATLGPRAKRALPILAHHVRWSVASPGARSFDLD